MDALIQFGGAVKALGDGKVGGYLVRFSGEDDPDLAGDFFTKSTDYDAEFPARLPVYYDHGQDATLGKKRLGRAEVKVEDVGLWAETQLDLADRYQAAIYNLVQKGALGYSSGSVAHLVDREPAGKAHYIKHWPLAECSLTPTPCEPRNSVQPLKSFQESVPSFKALLEQIEADEAQTKSKSDTAAAREPSSVLPLAESVDPTEAIIASLKSMEFGQFLRTMGAVAKETARRAEWRAEQTETKDGRPISADNLSAMQSICDGMAEHVGALRTLIDRHTKKGRGAPSPDALTEYIRFQTGMASHAANLTF